MKFKINATNLTFYYYNCYLSEDFMNDTSNIISPKLFNHNIIINSTDYYKFEIETELELERNKSQINFFGNNDNIIIENLYLIISFSGNVEVSTGEKPKDSNNNSSYIFIIIIVIILIILIIIIIIVIIYKKKIEKEKKKNYSQKLLMTSLSKSKSQFNDINYSNNYEKPTSNDVNNQVTGEYEKPTSFNLNNQKETDGNDNKYENNDKLPEKQIELGNIKESKDNNDNNNIRPSQAAPLPY